MSRFPPAIILVGDHFGDHFKRESFSKPSNDHFGDHFVFGRSFWWNHISHFDNYYIIVFMCTKQQGLAPKLPGLQFSRKNNLHFSDWNRAAGERFESHKISRSLRAPLFWPANSPGFLRFGCGEKRSPAARFQSDWSLVTPRDFESHNISRSQRAPLFGQRIRRGFWDSIATKNALLQGDFDRAGC